VLLAGAARLNADPALDARVLKIFDENCADCHSPTKHTNDKAKKPALDGSIDLGELRQNAKAVHPGSPETSKLYKVLLLDRSDKDSMPHSTKSKPRDALPPDEIEAIRQWIQGP
jgi:mono/diheme cytochrome c family protein